MKKIYTSKFKIKNVKKGFTLIELLIVIAIIGVLATLLMVNFVGVRQRARDAQRKSDLRQIQSALEMYRADNSSYPPSTSPSDFPNTCGTGVEFMKNQTIYMQTVPCDPLKTTYIYTSPIDITKPGTYSITACLENVSDNQKDTVSVAPCDTSGKSNRSFTVINP